MGNFQDQYGSLLTNHDCFLDSNNFHSKFGRKVMHRDSLTYGPPIRGKLSSDLNNKLADWKTILTSTGVVIIC